MRLNNDRLQCKQKLLRVSLVDQLDSIIAGLRISSGYSVG